MTYSKAAKLSRGLLFQFVLCGVEATIPASSIDHIEAGCGRSLTVIPRPQVRSTAFAKAICGADNDPLLFEQACIIAENDFVLRAIHAQQLAAVERVQEVTAIALAKGDNSLALAKARSLGSRLAYDELVALRDKVLQQYKDELPDSVETQAEQLIPGRLAVFLLDNEEASDQMEREAQGSATKLTNVSTNAMNSPPWSKRPQTSSGWTVTSVGPGRGKSVRSAIS